MKKGIVSALSMLTGAVMGAGTVGTMKGKEVQKWRDYSNKHLILFKMMCQWVTVKQEGKNLADYLEKKGYKKIAVYGMSFAGETLIGELKNTNVKVAYGIDKNADSIYADVDIVTMDDDIDEVDAIVVTAVTFFDEIAEALSEKIDCPIISLEDILDEV